MISSIFTSNANIIQLLQVLEIISDHKYCQKCEKECVIRKESHYTMGSAWRCNRCRKSYNLLDESSLAGKKNSEFVFLKFSFYFFNKNNFTADYIMHNCEIGEEKYESILSLIRTKISQYVINNKRKLEGI
ncbi:hypothetical protein DMUE_3935 [Dictyocoela muelleri]|nr:hypothetical protein DMUE_3935 [Dictyocoela muelleri]